MKIRTVCRDKAPSRRALVPSLRSSCSCGSRKLASGQAYLSHKIRRARHRIASGSDVSRQSRPDILDGNHYHH